MKTTIRLTESAIMLAAAFVLSLIPVINMPFGGSVTLCSMLPILLIAYRHGTLWGLLVGFAGALLQLLAGLNNLSYATSAAAAVAILMLDYVVAFTALGLGGLFRKTALSQTAGLVAGTLVACGIRYVCHVISGCTVWAGVSIPTEDGLLYSLAYNAAYMVPETVITVAAAIALSIALNLRSERPRAAAKAKGRPLSLILSLVAVLTATVGAVTLFSAMQTEEGFAVTAITATHIAVVAACAVVAVGTTVGAALTAKKRDR